MTEIKVLYEGPIVKRSDAKERGFKRYFTGKPCPNGHIDQRQTSNGTCYECQLIRSRDWLSNNREKKMKSEKEYRDKNKEKIKAKNKSWNERNPFYHRDRRPYVLEEIKTKGKIWREENKDKIRASRRNRRALFREAKGSHASEDIKQILDNQDNLCAEPTCRKDLSDGYHVDHIMPLSLGGSNWPDNLQCLCPTCNMRKHAKHPIDWAMENGRLC